MTNLKVSDATFWPTFTGCASVAVESMKPGEFCEVFISEGFYETLLALSQIDTDQMLELGYAMMKLEKEREQK